MRRRRGRITTMKAKRGRCPKGWKKRCVKRGGVRRRVRHRRRR